MKKTLLIATLMLLGMLTPMVNAQDTIYPYVVSSGQTIYCKFDNSRTYLRIVAPNNSTWDGYTKPTGNLVLPASVSLYGVTYPVTNIDRAFENCTGLTSVTIPNTVTSIGNYTFNRCTGLTSVTIPNSVATIGDVAFGECTGLTSVTIPNSVTTIGSAAFYGCSGLTSVTIPDSVTTISAGAFGGCTGLTLVTIPNSVTTIGSSAFAGCTGLTSITIPNSVTKMNGAAFYNCTGLSTINFNADSCVVEDGEYHQDYYTTTGQVFLQCSNVTTFNIGNNVRIIPKQICRGMVHLSTVTIPNSVTSIGNYAFYGCSGLTSVAIPNSVTSIGNYAFYGCSGLTSVTIPNSVTSIGNSVFYGCSGLTSVTIPNTVATIGNYAFYGCSGLTSVAIPNSVTSIGNYAFYGCSGLTSVAIPNSVTSIGNYAFYGCSGLTSVTIPNSVTSIGNSVFYECSGLTSVTIPNTVTTIGSAAFYGCSGLTSVTIPDSVTTISADAFRGCSGLTSVTIPNSVTSIGSNAFRDCNESMEVFLEPATPPTLQPNIVNNQYYYWTAFVFERNDTNYVYPLVIHRESFDSYWNNERWSSLRNGMCVDSCLFTLVNEDPSLGSASIRGTSAMSKLCAYRDSIGFDSYDVTEHYHAKWTWGNSEYDSTSLEFSNVVVRGKEYTVTCHFVIDTYYVHVTPNDITRGSVTSNDTTFIYGTPCTVEATAYTGYTFHHWSNGVTANPYTFVPVENTELTAIFIAPGEEVYTVTVNVNDPTMGSATVNGNSTVDVINGESVTLSAIANDGYRFVRWNDSDSQNPRNISVTADMSFTAFFEAVNNPDPQSIDDASNDDVHIYVYGSRIVVEGALHDEVRVFDIMGRNVRMERMTAGIYLVKVGKRPAKKVVVIR